MIANILVCIGVFLAFLELILWYSVRTYRHHRMVQIAVLLIGVGVLLGAHGFISL